MDTAGCKIGILKKQLLYQSQGKRLISLCPTNKPAKRAMLQAELRKYR